MNRKYSSEKKKNEYNLMNRILSMLLMFSLILQGMNIPALSVRASQELVCQKQEHQHTESCYQKNLVCSSQEHQHGDSCYDEQGNLICGLEAHIHGEQCYESVLGCGLEEHTHSADCYAVQTEAEAKQAVTEAVTDEPGTGAEPTTDETGTAAEPTTELIDSIKVIDVTEAAIDSPETVEDIDIVISADRKYAVANEEELVFQIDVTGGKEPLSKYYEIYCGQELQEGKSLEGDSVTYLPQSCGLYTLRVSVTDALGSTVGTEYTIPVAVNETENEEDWKASVKDAQLTGDYAADLVSIAKTQVSYKESTRNFVINDEDEQKGYTRYGDWNGAPYEDWNTAFVSFCLNYAKLPSEYSINGADSADWKKEHSEFYKDATYVPKAGDLIFFHNSADGDDTDPTVSNHMGIIKAVDEETGRIDTIEGDVQDKVSEATYSMSNPSIVGYVVIPSTGAENETEETEEAQTDETEAQTDETETQTDEIVAESMDAENMISVAADDAEETADEDASEEPEKIIIKKGDGKVEKNGAEYKIVVSDWNGNADKNDKLTGVLEKLEGDTWVTVTSFSGAKQDQCQYSGKSAADVNELLNTAYRFRFTYNNTTGENYEKNIVSDVFYLADGIKDGFRKWAVDVYPQLYNDGEQIQDVTGLKNAYDIYSTGDRKFVLTVAPEEMENLLGNVATFDISFYSSEELNKDKSIQLYLKGDNGVDITEEAEIALASSGLSDYISLSEPSDGVVTMTLLQKLPANTRVPLIYSFKINEGSTLGGHSLYGEVVCEKKTGEDLGTYQIAEPTSGWLFREAVLQNMEEILPKRDDREGTEVTYKITLTNYGDTERVIRKLTAAWSGGVLSSELLDGQVLPAATVTKNDDNTETRTPGTLELTCSFEAPASYESVENIIFTVTDSIRDSKTLTSGLKLKQDGVYWLVTADATTNISVDDSDTATFETVSATVTKNLDERSNSDVAINGKIQYYDESAGQWKTVTSHLTSPTSGTFSQVNVGSRFTAVFDTSYLTVDELLNTKYRFIANRANTKKGGKDNTIIYSDDDNAESINSSQPFYLVDKLEKAGFRDWVLNPDNGYDTAAMDLDALAEAYKRYSRLGLNVDVTAAQDGYEAGFDATYNVTISAESALNMNSEIRVKLSDITESLSDTEKITLLENLKAEENTTEYTQEISVEGDEIVIRMAKSLPAGSPLLLKVTSALQFATGIGAHTLSAHAVYKENGSIRLEDTDTGVLNVVRPSGWHILSIDEPSEPVYPGDEVYYTIHLKNFENDPVTFTTEEIRALFGTDKDALTISEYKDATGSLITDSFTLDGSGTAEITVGLISPVGKEAIGTQTVQFCVTDTAKTTETKDANMIFAKEEIKIEPIVTYDSTSGEYTVKLVCRDLYGSQIELHNLSWDSKDTEAGENWKTIGTQTITPTVSGNKKQYTDNAEFILTGENLAALEEKADSSVLLYRLNDTVSNKGYYSAPVYFDDLQELKDAAKLMVELAKELGYEYDEFSTILDYLYYTEVAKDSGVPFSDRSSFTQYLLKEYKAGGNQISAAVTAWKKYYTDMMDPNMSGRSTGHGSVSTLPTTKPQAYDWEDENLQYDKDEKGNSNPFHNVITSVIEGMDRFLQDGGLYNGSYFSDLSKTAAAEADGDANTERNYTIDIKANANGTVSVPTVVVFQIQTSWQMFDLEHANQVNGPAGAPCTVTDMATLYDIKHAMIDFAKYMKEQGDGSVCFAVTDVEHAGTFSMIQYPYFTNNMGHLIEGLEQWDIFGNCEHVHYTDTAYKNAVGAIQETTFENWKDGTGAKIFANAKKVAVVIGGSTENTSGKDGYGCVITDMGSQYLDCLYTIRCNSGTASPYLSWLDNAGMTNLVNKYNGIAFKDVTSREQLLSVFKAILQDVGRLGKIDAAKDVVLEDTIENEFSLIEDSIQLVTYDFDGNATAESIPVTDESLSITKNSDGTTTIRYLAGTVAYGETVHLRFKVQAKEKYIGSNNVKTNVGVPTLQYKNDIYGSKPAQMKFTDEPKVNVLVRYDIEDGGSTEVPVNTEVDLWKDLDAEKIVGKTGDKDGIEDRASGSEDQYDQINGTVTYQWEIQKLDEEGNPVTDDNGDPVYETIGESASVHVTDGKPDSAYPDLDTKFTPDKVGEYSLRLKTVFTPDDKTDDWSGENDGQVNASISYGYVTVKATDDVEPVNVSVIKNIENIKQVTDGFEDTVFAVAVTTADGASVVKKTDLISYENNKTDANIAKGSISISKETNLIFSELTQDDRALKFSFKALNITITDKDDKTKTLTFPAEQYSLNEKGQLTDADGKIVQVAVSPGDTLEAEFVNTFLSAPTPTGVRAGGYLKWMIAVIVLLGLSGAGFVMRKRRKEG